MQMIWTLSAGSFSELKEEFLLLMKAIKGMGMSIKTKYMRTGESNTNMPRSIWEALLVSFGTSKELILIEESTCG